MAAREARKERLREELGDQYESEEEEEEQEVEEEEEMEQEVEQEVDEVDKPSGPSPLLTSFIDQITPTHRWISMGGYDTGYLYQYSIGTNDTTVSNTVPIPSFNGQDIPIHTMRFKLVYMYINVNKTRPM